MKETVIVNLIDSKGDIQYGLNWGHRESRNPNQSYIQLPPNVYKSDFFPKKGKYFVVKTDDDQTIIMTRAQKTEDGTALQTPDNNALFGKYIRNRLGLEDGALITTKDILDYGRSTISFTKIDDLNYYMDFNNGIVNPNANKQNDEPLQLIYYGAPGTGKSFTIDKATNENNSVRTTFHPDSDYASFVGAYKPTMASMPVKAFVGTTVHHAKNADNEKVYEKKIVYKYVPQAFLKAYVDAWKRYVADEDNPYYLVIEEINRGNCAQIFGDLFQLLDRNDMGCSSYAISADEDIAQFLSEDEKGFGKLSDDQKEAIRNFVLKKDSGKKEYIGKEILNGSKLLLPPNLRIWATMNTSDQSLFPIDSAFKRRWNWKYMPIEYDPINKNTGDYLSWKLEVGDKTYSWGKFLEIINKEIENVTVSEDKQMGYFFAKPDKQDSAGKLDTISEKTFVNKVLFYLWTDVFKDYDLTKKPFIHQVNGKDGKIINKPFSFRNFFPIDNNSCLADFMSNLVEMGLNPLDGDNNTNTTGVNNNTEGNFSVNGIPVKWQNGVAAEAVREYIKAFPEKSATEIIQDWRNLGGPLVSHFIESKAENEARTDKDKTYVYAIDCKGETIFVSKQGWGDNRRNGSYYALLNMVNAITAKGWPIEIKGVE